MCHLFSLQMTLYGLKHVAVTYSVNGVVVWRLHLSVFVDDSLGFFTVVTTKIIGNCLDIRGEGEGVTTRSTGRSRSIVTLRHVCAVSLAHSDALLWKSLHLQIWETPAHYASSVVDVRATGTKVVCVEFAVIPRCWQLLHSHYKICLYKTTDF